VPLIGEGKSIQDGVRDPDQSGCSSLMRSRYLVQNSWYSADFVPIRPTLELGPVGVERPAVAGGLDGRTSCVKRRSNAPQGTAPNHTMAGHKFSMVLHRQRLALYYRAVDGAICGSTPLS
jgi:hypothetical protein